MKNSISHTLGPDNSIKTKVKTATFRKDTLRGNLPKTDTFRTDTVKLDTLKDIRPVKGLATFPYTIWEILIPISLIILVFGFVIFIWLRIKNKKGKPLLFKKAKSPLIMAQESYNLLETAYMNRSDTEANRFYYEGISTIFRQYLYTRFSIRGNFETSLQIKTELSSLILSDQDMASSLYFLKQADWLKFSGLPEAVKQLQEKDRFTTLLKNLDRINLSDHV